MGVASLVSLGVGYYLRFIVALAKKRSIELDLKQLELSAKNREKEIIDSAEKKAEEILSIVKFEIREKEDLIKKNEERLIKKDDLLDKRQADIEKEVEEVKKKIEEIKQIRENTEKIEAEKKE